MSDIKKLIKSMHNPDLKYCECALCEKKSLKNALKRIKHFEKRIEKYPNQITNEEIIEMKFLLQKVSDLTGEIIAPTK